MRPRLALLALLLLPAGPALARGVDGFTGVDVSAGMVDVDHYGLTWSLGLGFDFGLSDSLLMDVGVSYFKDSDKDSPVERTLRDMSFGTFLRLVIPTHGRVRPFVGAGLALHQIETQERFGTSDTWHTKTHDSSLGFDAGGGVLIPSSADLAWIAELRYRMTNNNVDSDHMQLTFGVLKGI